MACTYCWNWKKCRSSSFFPHMSAFGGTEYLLGFHPGVQDSGSGSWVPLHSSASNLLSFLGFPLQAALCCWSVNEEFWRKDFFLFNIFMTLSRKKKKERPKCLLASLTALIQTIDDLLQLINFLFCVGFHTERWGKREVFKNRKMWLQKHHCWLEDSVDSGNNVTPLFIML